MSVRDAIKEIVKAWQEDIISWHYETDKKEDFERINLAFEVLRKASQEKVHMCPEIESMNGMWTIDKRGDNEWYITAMLGANEPLKIVQCPCCGVPLL